MGHLTSWSSSSSSCQRVHTNDLCSAVCVCTRHSHCCTGGRSSSSYVLTGHERVVFSVFLPAFSLFYLLYFFLSSYILPYWVGDCNASWFPLPLVCLSQTVAITFPLIAWGNKACTLAKYNLGILTQETPMIHWMINVYFSGKFSLKTDSVDEVLEVTLELCIERESDGWACGGVAGAHEGHSDARATRGSALCHQEMPRDRSTRQLHTSLRVCQDRRYWNTHVSLS
jgi:hypothetical protein